MNKPLNIIIAGGGTGGHLFPGIAIADEFMKVNSQTKILFIGTNKPFETRTLSKAGYPHIKITAAGIKGMGILAKAISVLKIPVGILESAKIIKKFKPDIIIGLGGYSSGPVVVAAKLLNVKIAIHEQNFIPGITNRILSHLADRIFVSFKNTKIKFNFKKICLTGNPVRKEILKIRDIQQPSRDKKKFIILIIGGSQGAHHINITMLDTLKYLEKNNNLHFIHQTGPNDKSIVEQAYKNHNQSCKIKAFFNNMASLYQKADLIICRAGATTIAEITGVGKAALFIPFPFAADDHQAVNAKSLANSGAADLILEKELTPEKLAYKIQYYALHPEITKEMADSAKKFGRPDAGKIIIQNCYNLIS